jgi:hypothetical protein
MVLNYSARVAAVIRERELRGVGLLPGRNFYDFRNALHENIIVVVGEIVLQCVWCFVGQISKLQWKCVQWQPD